MDWPPNGRNAKPMRGAKTFLEASRGIAPVGELVVARIPDDAPVDERLIGDEQSSARVREIPPAHAVVRLVRDGAEVPAEAEVQREARAHLPVILHIGCEILDVELARIAGSSLDAEARRLEDAGARIVPEQHVGDGVAGEEPAERELAEEIVRQISLERPLPVVRAEVQRVTPPDRRRRVAHVPHRLVARLVVVAGAAGAGEAGPGAAEPDRRIRPLIVAQIGEDAGQRHGVDIGLRRGEPVLVRAGPDIADAELVDEVGRDRQGMRHLPVPRLLNEEHVPELGDRAQRRCSSSPSACSARTPCPSAIRAAGRCARVSWFVSVGRSRCRM